MKTNTTRYGPKCHGPKCTDDATVKGLCPAHYRQAYRKQPLRPLRERAGKGGPVVQIAARLELNLANALAQAATAKGLPLYRYAQDVLCAHARRLLRGVA